MSRSSKWKIDAAYHCEKSVESLSLNTDDFDTHRQRLKEKKVEISWMKSKWQSGIAKNDK